MESKKPLVLSRWLATVLLSLLAVACSNSPSSTLVRFQPMRSDWFSSPPQQLRPVQMEELKVAAGQGNAHAQARLGEHYHYGEGVPQNRKEAARWWKLAADQGHPDAQFRLGALFSGGSGVSQHYGKAVKWWRLAADQGHPDAQNSLGVSYFRGKGVPQNYWEAVKWWRLAADQGQVPAQYFLGWSYHSGIGVPRSWEEANRWWELAAWQGHAHSQYELGWAYYFGRGVRQSYGEAYVWFSVAEANGFDDVWGQRDKARQRLSRAALASAQEESKRRFNAIAERQSTAGTATPTGTAPSNTSRPLHEDAGTLWFTGTIGVGDVQRLEARIRQGGISTVALDSTGGSLSEAMAIGRLIRTHLLQTSVPDHSKCYSACVIAFVGGVERTSVGPLGIHSFYSEHLIGSRNFRYASAVYDTASEGLEAYLREMRIPLDLLDHMKRVSHEDMEILTAEQRQEYFLEGIDPVYRQTHSR